ncbi:O-antigen ligase family protein [Ornithinimicrobium humiphilum]|uniref:O-antigen ligase family protein n=1 Tax=Ornithinimicrobium humiphilum TaxID=125288 RepID=UPI00114DBCFE|nr:O-antigen ligase family protein [Ornithinimicrobium humiphilum]
MKLWYSEDRYSGLADNPHQLSLLMGGTLIFSGASAFAAKEGRARFAWAAVCGLSLIVGFATGSSTMLAAVAIGAGATVAAQVLRTSDKGPFLVLLGALVCVAAFDWVLDGIDSFLAADANGYGRLELWLTFDVVLDTSPIVGLGPGYHAGGGTEEFHNMYLDIWAVGGMLGLFSLVSILVLIAWRARSSPMLFACVMYLAGYGLAGFSARRLVFWLFLACVIAAAADPARVGPSPVKGLGAR